jgi:hypothetical protein
MQLKKKIVAISKKFKHPLRYYFYTKSKARHDPDSKVAVVNLGWFLLDKDWGRYSFIICQILKFSGFKVVVKLDYKFFYSLLPYKRMLLAQDYTKVRHTSVKPGFIELHGKNLEKKSIKLIYGYTLFRNKVEAYYLPYTLHPRFYQEYSDNTNFQAFRDTERKIRIIFAGNFEKSAYSRPILKEDFEGIITRVEVLDHISANYSKDSRIIYSPTKEHLYNLLETKSTVNNFIVIEVKTPEEDWLHILSKGDFYLCLPGGAMPLSHNAFESMALGTIPILQYDDLFYPPLQHLRNCIAYSSYDTLDEAIELALNMKEEALLLMKQEVIKYYDEYLATEQTIKRIQAFANSDEETMTIAIPFLNKK